jgi:hypothetical protein
MVHPGWVNDRETLTTAFREAGWFYTTMEAREAAENARLVWGWLGLDEDGNLRSCNWNGWCDEVDAYLIDVSHVSLARVITPGSNWAG